MHWNVFHKSIIIDRNYLFFLYATIYILLNIIWLKCKFKNNFFSKNRNHVVRNVVIHHSKFVRARFASLTIIRLFQNVDIYHRETGNLNSHIHSSDVFSYILLEIPLSLAHEYDNLVEGIVLLPPRLFFNFPSRDTMEDWRETCNIPISFLLSRISRGMKFKLRTDR